MRHRTEPGSALLVASLVATLLATAAIVLILSVRSAQASASEALRLEQARMQSETLLDAALVLLDSGSLTTPLNGASIILPEAIGEGEVRIQDSAGLLDLNVADSDQLAALFAAIGANAETARRLGDAVADWRDGDDLERPFGAEADDYAAAQAPPPGNRDFEIESELALVLGMPRALADCALAYVTVHSGLASPDLGAAPALLRQALRAGPGPASGSALGAPLGRVLIVTAEAPLSARAALRSARWVRLTGDPNRPVLTHRAKVEFAARNQPGAAESCKAAP